jgi:hypothetical protein
MVWWKTLIVIGVVVFILGGYLLGSRIGKRFLGSPNEEDNE